MRGDITGEVSLVDSEAGHVQRRQRQTSAGESSPRRRSHIAKLHRASSPQSNFPKPEARPWGCFARTGLDLFLIVEPRAMPGEISFRPVGAFEMGASCVPTLAAMRWGLGSRRFALIRGSIPPTEVRGETHGRYFCQHPIGESHRPTTPLVMESGTAYDAAMASNKEAPIP